MRRFVAATAGLVGAAGLLAMGLSVPASADVTGHEVISDSFNLNSSLNSHSLECPSGKIATGGGYAATDAEDFEFEKIGPNSEGDAWHVELRNNSGGAILDGLTIYVVCADEG